MAENQQRQPRHLIGLTERELRQAYVAVCQEKGRQEELPFSAARVLELEGLAQIFERRLERIRLAEQATSTGSVA
jgi:hypothetical protein